ncbi:D-alanyl-D-alanine carboxypeptidase/D-alanyl-D-alanine endopeptidase [Streptomyces cacaoi]|uniref:D-alanyl-D-alanine carboxypeptidase/D-alanyl-D-alanine endopeptidase n=1 Tax=Streptomyces cacaoi TaxID=1898 RepID=UPI003F4CE3A6
MCSRKGLVVVVDTASKVRDTANRAYRAAVRALRTVNHRARQRWRATTPHERQTVRLTAVAAALGLVISAVTVGAAGPWDSGQRTAERARAAGADGRSGTDHTGEPGGPTAAPVLAATGPLPGNRKADGAGGGSGGGSRQDGDGDGDDAAAGTGGGPAGQVPPPTASALADTLEPLLDEPSLGAVRSASVVDAASGRQLYTERSGAPATPASTVKLATAVAALTARGADHRITTRVVGEGSRVTLVGGGDPTLTPEALGDLAKKTAGALRKAGTRTVRLGYDTSRYRGTDQHPIGPNENLAPVTALMVDEGRLDSSDHGPAPRTDDPAGQAAEEFGKRLEAEGVELAGPAKAHTAAGGAKRLAAHRSAPLGALVERMLTHSDNDIAEALARQTALATGEEASFEGAGRAVERTLRRLDVPLKGAVFADGSGLDRTDKVTPALLTRLLVRAADPDRPELRGILTGLPVAGFTGTLGSRYGGERGEPGAGLVRAKTGTLTGVNTLAGTVVDADGRMLAFAFMTSGAKDPGAAEAGLDRLASTLANCGCRDSPSTG